MKKIGVVDAKIIKELLKDGRKSFAHIAKECGVSKKVIWKRYKEMKKAGIIVGATIQLDYKATDYKFLAEISLNVDFQQIDQITECLQRIPNFYRVLPSQSRYNLTVLMKLKNLTELDALKETIKRKAATMSKSEGVEASTQCPVALQKFKKKSLNFQFGKEGKISFPFKKTFVYHGLSGY